MTPELHEAIIEEIKLHMTEMIKQNNELTEQVIKETVNGKIDKANKISQEAVELAKAAAETAQHNSQETVRINRELTQSVEDIKNLIIPVVSIYTDSKSTLRVLKWLIGGSMLIGGFILLARNLLKGW